MASGRLFQVRGPAMANDLSPKEVCVRGTWSFPLSAETDEITAHVVLVYLADSFSWVN